MKHIHLFENHQLILYHGTPHVFHTFSTEFARKGEGIQAEGWGIYLTESLEKAKTYSVAGCVPTEFVVEPYIENVALTDTDVANLKIIILAAAEHRSNLVYQEKYVDTHVIKKRLERKNDLESIRLLKLIKNKQVIHQLLIQGYVYDVTLTNPVWFDRDAYLTPELLYSVKTAIAKNPVHTYKPEYLNRLLNFPSATDKGMHLYGCLSDYVGSEKQASLFLAALGFTGMRFKISGFFSYVVFNANSITILTKNLV